MRLAFASLKVSGTFFKFQLNSCILAPAFWQLLKVRVEWREIIFITLWQAVACFIPQFSISIPGLKFKFIFPILYDCLRSFCTLVFSKQWYVSLILKYLHVGVSNFSGDSKHTIVFIGIFHNIASLSACEVIQNNKINNMYAFLTNKMVHNIIFFC